MPENTANTEDKTLLDTENTENQDTSLLDEGSETPQDQQSQAQTTPETDQKSPEAKQPETSKDKEAKEKPKQGAPEQYAEFQIPEGMEVNPNLMEEFKTTAKELNLSQDQAQKMINLAVKHAQIIADSLTKTYQEIVSGWRQETIKELGTNYKKELTYAGKVIDRFGTPELRELFNKTGVGNHKEMVKFLIAIGKAISEDNFVQGTTKTRPKTDAELFYGDTMK